MKTINQKKGIQLNQAFGAVLTLVLVAILVIIAIVIFVSLENSFAGTDTFTTINETVTNAELTAGSQSVSVDNTSLCEAAAFSITIVQNSTAGGTINSQNYTFSGAGLLTNLTSEFSEEDWFVSYTGQWGGTACSASADMVTEFGNYTSLIGLVGTIIFLGLVIGVLITAFAFGGRKEV